MARRRVRAEPTAHEPPRRTGGPDAPFTAAEWQRIAVILIVAIFSIVFWMGFEQAGRDVHPLRRPEDEPRRSSASEFPASWYQSVNPLLIFILAPLFSMLWTTLDRTRFELTSTAKMGVGLMLLGARLRRDGGRRARGRDEAGSARTGWRSFISSTRWRALPLADRPLAGQQAGPGAGGLADDGDLVPLARRSPTTWPASSKHSLESSHVNLWAFLIFTSIVPGLILLALTPVLKKMGHGRI